LVKFFKYVYQISLVLPAVIGAVREVYYGLRSVFGSRSDLPAVSPLWPDDMDGEGGAGKKSSKGCSKSSKSCNMVKGGTLSLLLLVFVFSGCGSVLIPVATQIDIVAPDDAVIVFDGVEVGTGSIKDLLMFENFPNYLRIHNDSLDVRLIVITCPGLEAIGVR
jgi:hypothetical protein